ncbi:MAG: 23S rRNA pseudouridine synthase [Candidatus Peregrinibacteria bacterium Greene0416_62]|nr:MAG: 23S rRNA pseudouridine synthase [Candidatus Peregrinibacteria bacterium Greene0416_62]
MPWIVERPERLDNALMRFEAFSSRAEAQRSIHEGLIQVNGSVIERPSSRLKIGDSVSVISERMVEVSELKPSDLSFTILYEDPACLVIEKPAGFSVHPGAGMKKGEVTILHGIAYLFKKKKISFNASSVLVHRLDKETTGCLLIAKTPDAHRHLQKQFADRTVEKQYLALVAGVPSPPAAIIDAPIGRHSGDRTKMAVFHAVQSRREARTTYRTLAVSSGKDAALLCCDLHTGRTHQVRVHLKAIEHPVVGDSDYGNQRSRKIAEKYHIESLCLHAWKLKFRSPHDGKEHAIEAPLQENLQGAIHVLRISWDR